MTGLSQRTDPLLTGSDWSRYVRAVLDAAGPEDRLVVMAAVVRSLARVTGWSVPPELELGGVDLTTSAIGLQVAGLDPPEALADAWLPGRVYEALLGIDERHAAGVHYTPRRIATGLTAWATADGSALTAGALVCDPAVGGGAFLLAAAELLRSRGAEPADIVGELLWGIDLDPVAVAVAAAAISHWGWQTGGGAAVTPGHHLACSDALLAGASAWPCRDVGGGFDLVIGNPPFQSQLGRSTARLPQESAALSVQLGDAVTGYADSATLFLVSACRMVRPGGRVALLQPLSVFATRDATRARSQIMAGARLDGVWTAGTKVFEANVRVGAVVLEADGEPVSCDDPVLGRPIVVRRAAGPEFAPMTELATSRTELQDAASWSYLIVADGTPAVGHARTAGRMKDIASATAGFRDQYYGLIPFVVDAPEATGFDVVTAALVTSGMIDPGACRWGIAPGRFGGRTWWRPVVDVASVRTADPRLGQWLDRVLVPKVVVASQTRVVEAVVDEVGAFVPSVPVIAVKARVDRLFDVAAVLLSPHTSAWAVRRTAGAALGTDAIKLSAKQILDVPLPADADAWLQGAEHLRGEGGGLGDPATFASIMNRAYGLAPDGELAGWWLDRLPVHRP